MKKFFTKTILFISVFTLMLSCISASAINDIKLQFFFAPQILNDTTGDLVVDVNLKNFNTAVPKAYGKVCGFTFEFEYDSTAFDVKLNKDGKPQTIVDEKTLIKSTDDIEIESTPGRVVYTYLDETLKDNLISSDGTLFSFTLVAKNPMGFWNSDNRYYLRFVPSSIGVVTYSTDRLEVYSFYDTEGIDIGYGPYNYPPTLITPSVDKTLVFTKDINTVKVNDFTAETDAAPYQKNGKWMIPVRYLSENIGMKVEWNGDAMVAASYGEFKTLVINEKTDKLYINSMQYVPEVPFETINGRIYISTDVVTELYPDAEVKGNSESVTIYIP